MKNIQHIKNIRMKDIQPIKASNTWKNINSINQIQYMKTFGIIQGFQTVNIDYVFCRNTFPGDILQQLNLVTKFQLFTLVHFLR